MIRLGLPNQDFLSGEISPFVMCFESWFYTGKKLSSAALCKTSASFAVSFAIDLQGKGTNPL